MRFFPVRRLKEKASLALVVPTLILLAFLLSATTNTITNVSGVETEGVGVYWDRLCTDPILEIDWGTLTPGSAESLPPVYIRNEGFEPRYLYISTANWNPPEASKHISLECDCNLQSIDPFEILQTTLTLYITHNIEEITSFSFDILVAGLDALPGDVDGDGDVDFIDIFSYLAMAYGSEEGDSNYDPDCDFDGDGDVDSTDIFSYVALFYGMGA